MNKEKISQYLHNHPKRAAIIGISLFFIISLTIIGFAIYNSLFDKKISVINIDQYTNNIPTSKKEEIFSALFKTIKSNSSYDDLKLSSLTGKIREGSFLEKNGTSKDSYAGDFIVDIEEIQQTYHIYYSWYKDETKEGTSGYPTIVNCPSSYELTYNYFKCVSSTIDQTTITPYSYLGGVLPYEGKTKNGIIYSVYEISQYYNSDKQFLKLHISDCDNKVQENEKEEVIKAFKNYLNSIGLNSEDYSYKTTTTCDGEAS